MEEVMIARYLFLLVLVLALLAMCCQRYQLVDTIPAKNLTETRLTITYHRIQSFWNQHGRVPNRSDELPLLEGRDCSTKDGWGRELKWHSDGNTRVEVWSLGRDGIPGGAGEDSDIATMFVGKQKEQDEVATIYTKDQSQ